MNDDYFVDDIISQKIKRINSRRKGKRIKSGRKGKTGERNIVKILNLRFHNILSENPNWGCFSRSVGSGNRYSQTNLSSNANNVYSGDIFCENFNFVIESKNGYDIDFVTAFNGNKVIDMFLQQVQKDSIRCGKSPMLIWKKDRRQPLVFLQTIPNLLQFNFKYKMHYKEWL